MQPTWKPYSKIPYSLQRNGGFTLFISETEFCIVKENKILNFYKNGKEFERDNFKKEGNFMRDSARGFWLKGLKWYLVIVVFLLGLFIQSQAQALTVTVNGVNKDGSITAITDFRWTLEEDATYHVTPGIPATNWAVKFHKSYMPVVAAGDQSIPFPALDLAKHYFISVLPKAEGSYSIGGAQIAPGQTSVTIYVNQQPIPTAQISIFVF